MVYNVTDYLEYFNYEEATGSISIYTSVDKGFYSGISKIQFNPPIEYHNYITCDFSYGIFRTENENGDMRSLTTKEKIDFIRYINVKYKELDFTVPEFSGYIERLGEYKQWVKENKKKK